jgi:hypothetical protein
MLPGFCYPGSMYIAGFRYGLTSLVCAQPGGLAGFLFLRLGQIATV